MGQTSIVELVNITKTFGNVVAVNNFSLAVTTGEFMTLLGPSGCGKTTVLRLIAGFLKPDSGQILIKGKDFSKKAPYERRLGMVFQSYALFPHMKACDNVAFGLKLRKIKKEEIDKKVREALETVQLLECSERYPRELSGGQQQRIALARALVIEPDVLLFDEPLSNLDFKLRQQMRFELKAIQKKVGITAIYVTHDQTEALTMSDRIAIMNKGKLLQVGTPTEIYEKPANKFIANFIGEANFIEGKLLHVAEAKNELTIAMGNDLTLDIETVDWEEEKLKEKQEVSVAIRPHKFRISRKKTQRANSIEGKIENLAYIGSMIKYDVRLPDGTIVKVDQPLLKKIEFEIGERIYLEWDAEDCMILTE
ncbi:MAG: ABC transporter ATP-binding protein [Candidatus Bathyarchaeia archaeon]